MENSRLVQTPEGYWVLRDEMPISSWVREHKRLDHDRTVDFIIRYIREGTVAIDAGANIGTHTIAYLQAVGPEGIVVAYEPHPDHWAALRRNCPGAVSFRCALGSHVGHAYILEEPVNTGASCLTTKYTPLRVPLSTLDNDFRSMLPQGGWKHISLIKLDIEGYELEALKGAEDTVRCHRPVIWMEINNGALARQGHTGRDIEQWLRDHRYAYKWHTDKADFNSDMAELICIP